MLKTYITYLRESNFVKNMFMVISGTALAQIISFSLTPIISRLYSPSDMGVFGSFNAVYSVILAGVTLDYSQAIMLPKKKEEAINILILSCIATIIISAIICCFSFVFPTFLQRLMEAPNVWFLFFLILAVLFGGFNQSFQAWCVRIKEFKHTSASQVIRSLSSNSTQIGLGFLGGGPLALVGATVLGDILASFNLLWILLSDIWKYKKQIKIKSLKLLAHEYRDFPIFSSSQNVIDALSRGLPILLLSHFYGIAIAGAYAFGVRILSVPMHFVLTALRQVLFQKASETYNDGGRLFPLYIKVTLGLLGLAFVPAIILFIWSPCLFTWIFGSQWLDAGEYARWLVLWLTFFFCNLPSVIFAKIIRIQNISFLFAIIVLITRSLTLLIGGNFLSALHTIVLFSVAGLIINTIWIVMVGVTLLKRESIKIAHL